MPTTAVRIRARRLGAPLRSPPTLELAELSVPLSVRLDRLVQIRFPEVRPVLGCGVVLAVGGLPYQEVRETHFTGGSYDKIRIGQIGGVEVAFDCVLGDLVWL